MTAGLHTIPPTIEDGGHILLPWLREMRDERPVWRDAYGIWHVFRYADVARVISDPKVFSSDVGRVFPVGQKFTQGNLTRTDPPRHHTLLGLPASDRELFRSWADRLFDRDMADPNDPELARKVDDATADMVAYLGEYCADRRARPREDLISRLSAVEADGERLTDEEVVNFSVVLLIAGHITTTALLGNTVLCVDEHPDVWAELRADRSLVEAAVEEVLRYRSSFTQVARVTMVETELAGQVIPADVIVTPWLLSANRDEREFADPDRFDIHRRDNHHLAFGYGIHFCIGQLLARVEARVAVGVLLDRYAEIRLPPGVPLEFYGRGIFAARNVPVSVRPA